MLGKVIKHEFRATSRKIVPAYLGAILFTIFNKIILSSPVLQSAFDGKLKNVMMFLYGIAIFGVIIITIIMLFSRFSNSMLQDEAYLSHTLPVSVDTHIWGRLVVIAVWMITSVIVCSGNIFFFDLSNMSSVFSLVWRSFIEGCREINIPPAVMLLEVMIIAVTALVAFILPCYSCQVIGGQFKKLKNFISITVWMVMNFLTMYVFVKFVELLNNYFLKNSDKYYLTVEMYGGYMTTGNARLLHTSMGLVFLWLIAIGAIHYFITRYFLKNRLNLE